MEDSDNQEVESGYYRQTEDGFVGPFSREDLSGQLLAGEVRPDDLVQIAGTPIWQPVRVVLSRMEVPPLAPEPESALMQELPAWPALLRWMGRRLVREFQEPSPRSLAVLLAIGAVGLLASHLGGWLWVPWFLAVLAASMVLVATHRVFSGLGLAIASLALFYLLAPSRSPRAETMVVRTDSLTLAPSPPAAATPAPLATPSPVVAEIPGMPPTAPPLATAPASVVPLVAVVPAQPAAPLAAPAAVPVAAIAATPPPRPLTAVVPIGTPFPVPVPVASAPATGAAAAPANPQARSGALVIVRGEQSSGSGFIAQLGGKVYLFTNNHVAAGMRRPEFTLLDGTHLTPLGSESAAGHDIMRFALKELPRNFLEIATNLERTVQIGDQVLVLGNSGGGGVVTSLPGTVVGIGPDRLEVSAEFIPGNSGSPIIHVPTGRVLGIATYLTKRRDEFSSGAVSNSASMVVRRFGYRLDSVKTWEPVNWLAFQAENDQLEKISALTEDIYNFLGALGKRQTPNYATETLRRPAEEWKATVSRKQVSLADRRNATQSFLSTLRFMTRSDVAAADASIHYSFFREKLSRERAYRDELYKDFDTQLTRMSSPSLR